jgi:DNA-binding PadR family transcriptional regulator
MSTQVFEWPCFTAMSRGGSRRGGWFGPRGGFGAFGGFPGGPRARRGDIRTAALLLLAEGPLNGYQIMQEVERRSGGVWRPSPGAVYPALSQLVDEGLVRSDETGDRKTYVLTDEGRAQVDAREPGAPAPWEQMTESMSDDVGGLFREMRRVGMTAAQIAHLGSSEQIAQARRILADAYRSLHGVLGDDESDQ